LRRVTSPRAEQVTLGGMSEVKPSSTPSSTAGLDPPLATSVTALTDSQIFGDTAPTPTLER
jgi:hypothetical protein